MYEIDTKELVKAKENDDKALTQIIESNSGLLWSIVKRFLGRGYVYNFTDRGNAYDLRSWNTSSSGDFWLAERDGNNALRVTHSCGNNHETNVCANIYPLCIE